MTVAKGTGRPSRLCSQRVAALVCGLMRTGCQVTFRNSYVEKNAQRAIASEMNTGTILQSGLYYGGTEALA